MSGGTINSKMRLLMLVEFFFLSCVLRSSVLCSVCQNEPCSVVQTVVSSVPHWSWNHYFSMFCTLQQDGFLVSFLLLCTFSGKYRDWHNPRTVQTGAKGKGRPKIAGYRLNSLEGTVLPCLKCLCSQRAGIELTASCLLPLSEKINYQKMPSEKSAPLS